MYQKDLVEGHPINQISFDFNKAETKYQHMNNVAQVTTKKIQAIGYNFSKWPSFRDNGMLARLLLLVKLRPTHLKRRSLKPCHHLQNTKTVNNMKMMLNWYL